MPYSYYDDLSGDDVQSGGDDTDDEESSSCSSTRNEDLFFLGESPSSRGNRNRIILHCDVDCFYCQCEMLDRNLPADRPIAIGQKHIIVTCNYEARQTYGVKKLESRQDALRKCPCLLILEGSDLERYRIHARAIYDSFRRACKGLPTIPGMSVPVCKGSMDEMMADLSHVVSGGDCKGQHGTTNTDVYVYGNQTDRLTLTEDQSGSSAHVVTTTTGRDSMRKAAIATKETQQRLDNASQWALQVRETILRETGFTTTMGLSVNPLLAKIMSGLRQPHSTPSISWRQKAVNVLYPSRSDSIMAAMPLRKISGIGHRTSKILEPCLRAAWQQRNPAHSMPVFWTCRLVSAQFAQNNNSICNCFPHVRTSSYRHTGICFTFLAKKSNGVLKRCQPFRRIGAFVRCLGSIK
jgi:nucleotidyltransferase/DNA polymerase involved in DNA repair